MVYCGKNFGFRQAECPRDKVRLQFKKKFYCLGGNTENDDIFTILFDRLSQIFDMLFVMRKLAFNWLLKKKFCA